MQTTVTIHKICNQGEKLFATARLPLWRWVPGRVCGRGRRKRWHFRNTANDALRCP